MSCSFGARSEWFGPENSCTPNLPVHLMAAQGWGTRKGGDLDVDIVQWFELGGTLRIEAPEDLQVLVGEKLDMSQKCALTAQKIKHSLG